MEREYFEKYLTERYNDQIIWYNNKSNKNKQLYYAFQWGVIILSASIPVVIALIPQKFKWISITLSILLAIGASGLKTFKFQEKWINYRTFLETLKKEKYFYDAGVNEYSKVKDKASIFVERVESLISKENSQWIDHFKSKDIEKNSSENSP